MSTRSFLGHALVYGLGGMLLQAVGIVLLPLYTRFLSPAEYGLLEVFTRLGEVVGLCLLLNGLRQGIIVFHGQGEGESQRRQVAATAVTVTALGGVLGGALALALLGPLAERFGLGDPLLLRLAVLGILLEALCSVLLALSQARLESGFFVAVTFSQVVVRIGLSAVFVACLGWGVYGVVIASLVTSGMYLPVVLLRELRRGGVRLNVRLAREMILFALPLFPCGLCFFLLNQGDRFLLLHWAGQHEVGLYAFGYKLAAAVTLFSRAPLMMVWGPHIYEVARGPDAPVVFGRAFTRILGAYLFVGLGVCLLQDEAIAVVGGAAFVGAAAVVVPVVLANGCLTAADLMDAAFYVRRRPVLKLAVALASAALMTLLYLLLIPRWGGVGAAYATLGGFAGHALLTRLVSQRLLRVQYEVGRLVGMVVLAAALWGVSRLLPAALWAVPLKGGLWLLWPVLLWKVGLVSPAEKQLVQSGMRQAGVWLRGLVPSRCAGEAR
ncbi:MAG: lipopolysaccharide biosynthesis protein [Gemmataceae bacterium]|nr:lipopolysaccharide biosynthesis protein [Gemmataceae bacterium]